MLSVPGPEHRCWREDKVSFGNRLEDKISPCPEGNKISPCPESTPERSRSAGASQRKSWGRRSRICRLLASGACSTPGTPPPHQPFPHLAKFSELQRSAAPGRHTSRPPPDTCPRVLDVLEWAGVSVSSGRRGLPCRVGCEVQSADCRAQVQIEHNPLCRAVRDRLAVIGCYCKVKANTAIFDLVAFLAWRVVFWPCRAVTVGKARAGQVTHERPMAL